MFRWQVFLQRQAEGFPNGVLEYTHIFVIAADEEKAVEEAMRMFDKRTDKVENPEAGGIAWSLREFDDNRQNPNMLGGRLD